ncbi:MAG: ATPase [Rhodobacteraceae bacterium]|nr:ATPase [Paracoccaceae bacterium]
MSDWKVKRFWTSAQVEKLDDGFAVNLDGRPVKTPAKARLVAPTETMAREIAQEWDAQEEVVNPATMPFTRSANAAIDKVSVQHAEVAGMLAAYGDSDLLCYRADGPQSLVDRQAELWDPLLDWAERDLGARLHPVVGVMHAPQNDAALKTLSDQTHAFTAFELAAFHDLVGLSGSLILGFAAARDHMPVLDLWTLSRLDELWQQEQWGVDEEAEETAKVKEAEFLHAKRFFDASQV